MSLPPLCRWCGRGIRRRTKNISFGMFGIGDLRKVYPMTVAEAQVHSNMQIVSHRFVERDSVMEKTHGHYICDVWVWDGVSYVDRYFCNGEHAKLFAHLMAGQGEGTSMFEAAMNERKLKEEA